MHGITYSHLKAQKYNNLTNCPYLRLNIIGLGSNCKEEFLNNTISEAKKYKISLVLQK
jgi:hypothetical protein